MKTTSTSRRNFIIYFNGGLISLMGIPAIILTDVYPYRERQQKPIMAVAIQLTVCISLTDIWLTASLKQLNAVPCKETEFLSSYGAQLRDALLPSCRSGQLNFRPLHRYRGWCKTVNCGAVRLSRWDWCAAACFIRLCCHVYSPPHPQRSPCYRCQMIDAGSQMRACKRSFNKCCNNEAF